MPVGILAIGSHVPDVVIGNEEIAEWSGAPVDWIVERTGIHRRRYAAPGVATSDLALNAVDQIFAEHPSARDQVIALIVATCTPDVPQPATAAILHHKLGLRTIPAFDVNAVCCGFLFSLDIAKGLLGSTPPAATVLVVGADRFSTVMDRTDRRTVSLFGDGAGAVLVGQVPNDYGLIASRLMTDGDLHHYIGIPAGEQLLRMDGRAIKEYAMVTLGKLVDGVLQEAGLNIGDIDRIVLHQANVRLLENFSADAGIDPARVTLTAPEYGNTAGASIPITMRAAHEKRRFERDELVLMAAIGGGMTGAATVLRWY